MVDSVRFGMRYIAGFDTRAASTVLCNQQCWLQFLVAGARRIIASVLAPGNWYFSFRVHRQNKISARCLQEIARLEGVGDIAPRRQAARDPTFRRGCAARAEFRPHWPELDCDS